jgi:hypothetical protein
MGRPSLYTQELGDQICERLGDGESLLKICKGEDMPSKTTVFKWIHQDADFADNYARAREAQAEGFAEEIVAIADTGDIDRIKTQVDARKWVASKILAKKYGDRLDLNMTGGLNITSLTDEELDAKLRALRADTFTEA